MRILLCCAVGMSTSLLVRKMKKYAETNNIDCTIWAIPAEAINHHLDKADVILLGPQVRFLLRDVTKMASKKEIPVSIINTVDYGKFNAKEVLDLAVKLVSEKKNSGLAFLDGQQ
ncbi:MULTISPECIES: PTS sugar transporter subunit IIB [Bacillaceae]|uniref:PTS sugar transporter subunit IIB n=1 Tax=Bacillaceae TaxID=186817 RepID=UPI001E427B45|nr:MULTISPECIES: PTS sugar transporter subunit IIB [Bacillaceae]MCE4048534.1 PTS sugar transporter subunit IIB [Bacillus sp. Au-Bac7]MDL0434906.1 PTS sugar transporter subunit IIB [Niallia sp. SS-2023]UPO88719.1 PTS sugar transporter subunit IIB [Niallia sp. Man26]